MSYKVVVVGYRECWAEMLNILSEREFPISEIAAVASQAHWVLSVASGNGF